VWGTATGGDQTLGVVFVVIGIPSSYNAVILAARRNREGRRGRELPPATFTLPNSLTIMA
jgi:hypothetical protein